MIKLSRDRQAVDAKFCGANLVAMSLRLVTERRDILRGTLARHDFDSNVWKIAKPQLLVETADKCAYCEAPTAVVAYGDVEHYRPKSKYWWLAYCVDNYLASCVICNQSFKRDKFPIGNSPMGSPKVRLNTSDSQLSVLSQSLVPDPFDPVATSNFAVAHNDERPFPINPYFDDPKAYFAWRADTVLAEVELVPSSGVRLVQNVVEAAEDIYGLNRLQLRKLRYFFFSLYKTFKETLLDAGISPVTQAANQKSIADMALSSSPFAGMIQFFEAQGQPPDWAANGWLIK